MALLLAAASAGAAGDAELYGKPLRGLTRVPIAALVADPARFAEKVIRVTGTAEGETASLTLSEGDARVALEAGGGFALPEGLSGARLTAEGKLRKGGKGPLVFVATGVEVRR